MSDSCSSFPLTGFCLSRCHYTGGDGDGGRRTFRANRLSQFDSLFRTLVYEQSTCCSRLATYLFHGNFTYIRRSARFISPFRSLLGKLHPRTSSTGCWNHWKHPYRSYNFKVIFSTRTFHFILDGTRILRFDHSNKNLTQTQTAR